MIPRIIHQTWKEQALPERFRTLSETWRAKHPDWAWRLWTDVDNLTLVTERFPHLLDLYQSYPYPIQRVDMVRYLILYLHGGLYVDLDFECFRCVEPLLEGKPCLLSLEAPEHGRVHGRTKIVSNAFLAAEPGHHLFEAVIEDLKRHRSRETRRDRIILDTTGPMMLTRVLERLGEGGGTEVDLLGPEYLFPLSLNEADSLRSGPRSPEIRRKLDGAYGMHWHDGTWWRPAPADRARTSAVSPTPPAGRRPYLLFSSVGDSYDPAVLSWSGEGSAGNRRADQQRDYDIALVYYGDSLERFAWLASRSDRIYWSRGSKFQNLMRHLDAIAALEYRYLWVVDDDIALLPRQINQLFRISEDFGLAASQPAFSPSGLVCHELTRTAGSRNLLRYSNFVEIGCPVLSRRSLEMLGEVIRPHMDHLACWGIDILLAHHVWSPESPFAVIDAVTVRNPHQAEKRGGQRECERVDPIDALRGRWLAVRSRMATPGLPAEAQLEELGTVRKGQNKVQGRRLLSG
jgi:hypothetical protein